MPFAGCRKKLVVPATPKHVSGVILNMRVVDTIAHWLGMVFNLSGMLTLYRLPAFLRSWVIFKRSLGMQAKFWDSCPRLGEDIKSMRFDAHYFYQGAWLARKLAQSRPARHIDIGSYVQTIGVLSAFVDTVFNEYRPLSVSLPGLTCEGTDILNMGFPSASVMSLSCLHVIEHVGLGRYGDPIDVQGSAKAAMELSRVLANNGSLFLSVPVGRERVCFNAHRVFSPKTVLGMFPELALIEFCYVDDRGEYHQSVLPENAESCEYGCGMFHFRKASP
jgi:hypothetical protein